MLSFFKGWRCLWPLALALAMASCTPTDLSSWRPAAPTRYAVASRPPRIRESQEFSPPVQRVGECRDTRGEVPPLPPLQAMGEANPYQGLQPVRVTVAGDGPERSLPVHPSNLDPRGLQPLEQLVYGGTHPQHDIVGEYRFNVRDRLEIRVAQHPEFGGEVEVQQDGSIASPNTDDYVIVKGLNEDQAVRAIGAKVAPYVKDPPKVRVNITFGRGESYYVFGEVRNQGRFPMGITPIRLSEAIFRANSVRLGSYTISESREDRLREEMEGSPREGFSVPTYANFSQVSVVTPHRSHPTRRVYNTKAALLQGVTGGDPVIQPGQIIFVPSTGDARIIRFFNRVIAPIKVVGETDAEASHWYGRITGNRIKGVAPSVYEVKGSGLTQ